MADREAVVVHNVAAMRAEPEGDAEQVTQALFGEPVRLVEERGAWALIETAEPYQGWALRAHLAAGPGIGGEAMRVQSLFAPARSAPRDDGELVTLLPIGVEVRAQSASGEFVEIAVAERGAWFIRASDLVPASDALPEPSGANLVAAASRFRGVPYLWGGRSSFGIDCSGFTQRAYALCGVLTPRDAGEQAEWERMDAVERGDLQAGDLVFFAGGGDPHGRTISHVGMAMGDGRFIHSRGGYGVVVNALTDEPFDRIYWGARRMRGQR